ncbi:hypothetical protein PV326_002952 [Microctonus aethiopoides]|nr:hypothetical protein PV326_002952 [Microctonus aethiopoides]
MPAHCSLDLFFINHEESITKTSHEQQWGKFSVRHFVKENKHDLSDLTTNVTTAIAVIDSAVPTMPLPLTNIAYFGRAKYVRIKSGILTKKF